MFAWWLSTISLVPMGTISGFWVTGMDVLSSGREILGNIEKCSRGFLIRD